MPSRSAALKKTKRRKKSSLGPVGRGVHASNPRRPLPPHHHLHHHQPRRLLLQNRPPSLLPLPKPPHPRRRHRLRRLRRSPSLPLKRPQGLRPRKARRPSQQKLQSRRQRPAQRRRSRRKPQLPRQKARRRNSEAALRRVERLTDQYDRGVLLARAGAPRFRLSH
jgi:hypothetical protein